MPQFHLLQNAVQRMREPTEELLSFAGSDGANTLNR